MKRFVIGTVALATVVGALAASGVLGSAIDAIPEGDCAYGSSSNSNEALACKSRPKPDEAERKAAADGSALRRAIVAFRRTDDGERRVVGVGLNRWGDTTFSIPTGETAFGKARERFVTFDRSGGRPSQSKPAQRNYEMVTTEGEPFGVGRVRPAAVRRALRRIRRAAPQATFLAASYSRSPIGTGQLWMLRYTSGSGASTSGILFQMKADGSGLCTLGGTSRAGIGKCGFSLPTGGSTGIEIGPGTTTPPVPALSPQAECVKKAGMDVAKLQACVN